MIEPLLRVVARGALSLVQDSGRRGYQRYGVSVGGAMDQEALLLGNRLVGNGPGAAAIEVTLGGAEFEFLRPCLFAVTGADLGASLDDAPVPLWQSVCAEAGAVLAFAGPVSGLRAYLCVEGGIDTTPVLGSRSTHVGSGLGGIAGGRLEAGDVLPGGAPGPGAAPGMQVPVALRPAYLTDLVLRTMAGPQESHFSEAGVRTLYNSAYAISDRSDRQGARLDGPAIESLNGRYDIVSDAVVPGSVQVPGDGKPIILLADRQTTGGYAKIGTVASVDLPLLAQAPPGAAVRFVPISVAESQASAKARRLALQTTEFEMVSPGPEFSLRIGARAFSVRVQATAGRDGPLMATVDGELVEVGLQHLG